VTIGDNLPSLLDRSVPLTPGDEPLTPNLDGERNSGEESLCESLFRRSWGFEPASGDEFRTDPMESDSSVAELDSSMLQDALSAISEIRTEGLIYYLVKHPNEDQYKHPNYLHNTMHYFNTGIQLSC